MAKATNPIIVKTEQLTDELAGKISLFAVRNQEGKWFRRKGYGGYGDTWTDDFKQARIYNSIGPARGVLVFFANKWPTYGIPDLVQFNVASISVHDEKARVEKQKAAKERSEARLRERSAKWEKESAEKLVLAAQRDLQNAKARLQKLGE